MREPLRIGLVGCGRLVENGYLPAIERIRGVSLAAIADPVLSRCERLAPGTPAHVDAEALLAADEVDALILATPAAAHLPDAKRAADARVRTLVEKPPALDVGEAAALASLNPPPWIGFNRRFEPWLLELASRIPRERALDLQIELRYPADQWRSYVVKDDLLLTIGPHLIDLARWLTGMDIARARASALGPSHLRVDLELGAASASISAAQGGPLRDSVTISAGDDVIAHWKAHTLVGRGRRWFARRGAPTTLVKSLMLQLEAFDRAVRGEPAEPLATAVDGLAVMAAIKAARESSEANGQWRPVDPHIE